MSAGVVVLAPGAVTHAMVAPAVGAVIHGVVTVAAIGGVAIVGVAATVLLARAAVAGARVLAGSLAQLDESLRDAERRQVEAQCAAVEAEVRWQAAAAAAVDLNAQLRTVRAAARRAGGPAPDLPPPVTLAGRNLIEVLADCRRAAERIDQAKRGLGQAWRRNAAQLMDASLPGRPAGQRPRVDWLAWAGQGAVATATGSAPRPASREATPSRDTGSRDTGSRDTRSHAARSRDVEGEIGAALARLDRDAEPADLRRAIQAAERAHGSPDMWLIQLGRTVDQINLNLERRRHEAYEASVLLEGLTAGETDPDTPDVGPVVAQLERVVAGETDLTESLREDARWLIAQRERIAETRVLTARVQAVLAEQGFDVQADFGFVGRPVDTLRAAWPGRPDHSASIAVHDGRIDYQVVAHRAAADDNQRRADAAACADLGRLMRGLHDGLAAVGAAVSMSEISHQVRVEPRRVESSPGYQTEPRRRERRLG